MLVYGATYNPPTTDSQWLPTESVTEIKYWGIISYFSRVYQIQTAANKAPPRLEGTKFTFTTSSYHAQFFQRASYGMFITGKLYRVGRVNP